MRVHGQQTQFRARDLAPVPAGITTPAGIVPAGITTPAGIVPADIVTPANIVIPAKAGIQTQGRPIRGRGLQARTPSTPARGDN